ncbi:MAG: hypothetical protein JXA22_03030 [Candidatus Thermoplasmatota archaeon]|nr:hypothetical protein [Candidatus Thermoplasmatota archaeon]
MISMNHQARSIGIAIMMLLSSVLMVGVIAQESDLRNEPNVHGTVKDALTEDPLLAFIHIVGREKEILYTLETGRDGTFKIYLSPGAYIWEAEAEGYSSGRGEFKVGEEPIRLPILLKPLEEDPEEPPEYNLAGMLIDVNTGNGVPGLIAFWNTDGKGTQIDTDERGHFTILLPPGPWMWKATARGYNMQEGRLLMALEPIRLIIDLVPLKNEEPEPPQQSFGILYGHVMTPEGEPIAGAKVHLHPVLMDGSLLDPAIPEDPLVRPQETDRLTASGEDPDGQNTRGENDVVTSVTYREFYAKFSERFDEKAIKKVFSAADVDGDGVLNEREMVKARTLLREISGEDDQKDPGLPERMPLQATTNEDGMFRMKVPFGEFVVKVEARGFHPGRVSVRISPRMDENKVRIVLEPIMKGPDKDPDPERMKVTFSMIDQNSDGNPEKVDLAADLDGDGINEIEFHMIDRTSDGNPESVEWVLDVPMEMWEKIMGMVMMFIKNQQGGWDGIPTMPEDLEEWEDEDYGNDDLPFDLSILEEIFGTDDEMKDDVSPAETDDASDGNEEPSAVSEKGSASAVGIPVFEVLAVASILLLVMAGILGMVLFIRRKRN